MVAESGSAGSERAVNDSPQIEGPQIEGPQIEGPQIEGPLSTSASNA